MSAPQGAAPQHRPAQTTSKLAPQPQPSKSASNKQTPAPPQPDTAQAAPKEWTDDDYVLALAHLEQLRDVVTSLRTTIPQLVRSLTRPHETPKELYDGFSKEAIKGSKRLMELRKLWEGSDMRDIRVKLDGSIRQHGLGMDGVPEEFRSEVKESVTEMWKWGWMEKAEELRTVKGVKVTLHEHGWLDSSHGETRW